jgi:peptidoglycan/LPS O-acetylase OafA/YrhL
MSGARKFVALDGIRGLAAVLVMMRHTSGMWGFRFAHGYLAVDLFFLLSGFVIASSYEARLADGRLSVAAFVKLRLIRFYPMYLVGVALGAWLAWHPQAQDVDRLAPGAVLVFALKALLFLPSVGASAFPLLGVTWSLFHELVVNVLYAVVRPALSTRRLLLVAAAAFVALAAAAVAHGSADMGMSGDVVGLVEGLVRAVFGIFLGIAVFRLRHRLWARLPRVPSWMAIVAAAALLCAPAAGPAWVVDLLGIPLMAPLMLLAARADPPMGRLMLWLGSASYPVYLLHGPLHLALERGVDMRSWAPWAGVCFATGAVVLGILLERVYDLPLRRWLSESLRARWSSAPGLRSPAA